MIYAANFGHLDLTQNYHASIILLIFLSYLVKSPSLKNTLSNMNPFLLIPLISLSSASGFPPSASPRNDKEDWHEESSLIDFSIGNRQFMLEGEPFVIKAAELHYPRIPREYWDHRIKMCKALGMNTVCLYVFWNAHEEERGQYDFSGQNDVRAFVELCEANDMKVILRPGPYVCAEWEMGGLPWWLLRDKDIQLRENDPQFITKVAEFQEALAKELKGLTAPEGGPIIMLQVENEYGSYGTDKPYIREIRDLLRKNFGEVVMFQCDWESNFLNNGLEDLLWTMNFGTGADIDQQFAKLKEVRPDSPLMCSEYWSGWFDKWGASHETRSADDMTAGIDELLSKGISFSLYMTHGGTNWGHWAGANSPGYAPDVTSYDYDAPINESGRPTEKYYLLREVMKKHSTGDSLPPVPDSIPTITVDRFTLTEYAPLFDNLRDSIRDTHPRNMEEYGQGFGSILYRTMIPASETESVLTITDPHDFAQIFVDGNYIGSLDRRKNEKRLSLPPTDHVSTLDILVEATGRINFGRAIKDFKGISEGVALHTGEKTIIPDDWTIYPLPDSPQFYDALNFRRLPEAKTTDERNRLPRGAYRGTFTLNNTGDTFLDLSTWGKGLVYVNGHGIGRIWEIGPQQTLYTPGCWLKKGENEIMIFDVVGPREVSVDGKSYPILDKLQASEHKEEIKSIDTSRAQKCAEGRFSAGGGWQSIRFDRKRTGRYLIIEALDAIDGKDKAAIAELYLTDENGRRLSRETWRAVFADSEEITDANRTADKIYDLQESTSWTTANDDPFPHIIVIDLGDNTEVSGLDYLPRMEAGTPGAIGNYRIYLSDNY